MPSRLGCDTAFVMEAQLAKMVGPSDNHRPPQWDEEEERINFSLLGSPHTVALFLPDIQAITDETWLVPGALCFADSDGATEPSPELTLGCESINELVGQQGGVAQHTANLL